MKKTIIGTLLVSSIVLGGMSTTALAAPTNVVTDSTGKATFVTKPEDIHAVKPQSKEEIAANTSKEAENIQVKTGEVAVKATDGVALLHVPSFNFGTNKIKAADTRYPVLNDSIRTVVWEEFEDDRPDEIDETKSSQVPYDIPQFVQVADVSGKFDTKWNVKVKQKAEFKEKGGEVLKDSYIELNKAAQRNDNAAPVDVLTALSITEAAKLSIPVGDTATALNVMSRKAAVAGSEKASSTNGTISSTVFNSDYTSAAYDLTNTPTASATKEGKTVYNVDTYNDDVQLFVKKQAIVADSEYSATLEWTLEVGE